MGVSSSVNRTLQGRAPLTPGHIRRQRSSSSASVLSSKGQACALRGLTQTSPASTTILAQFIGARRLWKMIDSSRRLRNSGPDERRRASFTRFCHLRLGGPGGIHRKIPESRHCRVFFLDC